MRTSFAALLLLSLFAGALAAEAFEDNLAAWFAAHDNNPGKACKGLAKVANHNVQTRWHHASNVITNNGIDEFISACQSWWTLAPDAKFTGLSIESIGDATYAAWTWAGKCGATPVSANALSKIRRVGGKAVEWDVYGDFSGIVQQCNGGAKQEL